MHPGSGRLEKAETLNHTTRRGQALRVHPGRGKGGGPVVAALLAEGFLAGRSGWQGDGTARPRAPNGWAALAWVEGVRSHKLLTAAGATAVGGAAAYVFKDSLSGALKPLSDRLLKFALAQEMGRMKEDARGAGRQAVFRETGNAARHAAFMFLPQIEKRLRQVLNKKAVVKSLRECGKEAAEGGPGSEGATSLKKRKIALWGELVAIQVAQYAAAIYASSVLIASFRLHLSVLSRHKLDRQSNHERSTNSADSDEIGGGERKAEPFSHSLDDLGSQDTREALHAHAYQAVDTSLGPIASMPTGREDVLMTPNGWEPHL